MELPQLEQIVNWLDEEHKRNRTEIVRLGHLLEMQGNSQVGQTKQLQELEGTVMRFEAQVSRLQQYESTLDGSRQELLALIEREETQRIKAIRELERAREADRDTAQRDIAALQRDAHRSTQLEQDLQIRQSDFTRLAESLQAMDGQIKALEAALEEKTQNIDFMLELRSTEVQRITQQQEEQTVHLRRLDELESTNIQQDQEIRRLRQELTELHESGNRHGRNLDELADEMRGQMIDFSKQIRAVDAAVQELPPLIEGLQNQLRLQAEAQDHIRRSVLDSRGLREQIDQAIHQFQEAERLFQARIESSLEEAKAGVAERERKERMQRDHQWQEQAQDNAATKESLMSVSQSLKTHEALLKQLWSLQETYPQQALRAAQSQVDNLQDSLRERDRIIRALEDEWMRLRRNVELYANGSSGQEADGMDGSAVP